MAKKIQVMNKSVIVMKTAILIKRTNTSQSILISDLNGNINGSENSRQNDFAYAYFRDELKGKVNKG